MKYFPDEPADGAWAGYAVAAMPLAYLVLALVYSANAAPWGRQVDPKSAYMMNGLAWATGYPMIKNDHPGTTTILLCGLVARLCAFLSGRSDIIEFGLQNYSAMIYATRAAEALVLSCALLAGGVIVRRAARSWIAAALFQVAPFVSAETVHFEVMLTTESLMVSFAVLGTALVLKAALDERPPTIGLGVAQGIVFALGLSSKYLYAPLAIFSLSLLRNWRAYAAATFVGAFLFFILNRVLNPYVFTSGFRWLVSLATHKGIYGEGEPGFIDFNMFWSNMAAIIVAQPIVSVVFATGAFAALTRMLTSRNYLDPISLTLLASVLAFAAQLVATSKHFNLHYMVGSWVLMGGVLVLTVIEVRRLWPAVSPRLAAGLAGLACSVVIATTLVQIRSEAADWIAANKIGARLSRAAVAAGPACANVSAMFVRAPENQLNHGADMTLATRAMEDRFSEAYARAFQVPLLDHNFYRHLLLRNFHPYSYAELAAEYPCIIARISHELDATTSSGLLDLKPEHCQIEDIHVYTVGIACGKVRESYANLPASD